ncbi:hypothetical protein CQW23_03995 [Capsicum baccatum]|uniref:Uncharacterized protein n=1 Tax=Capsicum baccatum TaxID=33114 RepID=A0A2G2XDI8_CAPBA|nr:hypothetical protein CQW23_03995 [Capsicum baccatum]
MLDTDADVLRFTNSLKVKDFVNVYVVHQISELIVVNEDVTATPPLLLLSNGDVAAPFETDKRSDFDKKLLQARKSNIEKQAKEKADRVNLDEIQSGPVGINADFEEICKNKGVRYEGKLGRNDPYFGSLNSDSDISEEKGDPVDDDELKKNFSRSCGSQPSVQAGASTAAAERPANASAGEDMPANAKPRNRSPAGRPANAHHAPRAVERPTNVVSVSGVMPASALTTDIRPTTAVMPATTSAVDDNTTQSTTQ